MTAKVEKISADILFRSQPDGVMPEQQIEGVLFGFFYRCMHTRDRRSEGDQATNTETGMPESGNSLLPKHRALEGPELALELIIPPQAFIEAILRTDELPENEGKAEHEKEWRALCYKEKFKRGPNGRPLCIYRCNGLGRDKSCQEEWRAERPQGGLPAVVCRRCGAFGCAVIMGEVKQAVEERVLDAWSDLEVSAVKENARRLKRVVHRLAATGLFVTRPQIDEKAAELGTDHLVHGADGMTMGFKITPDGLRHAEEWARLHPRFMHGENILDAMGPTIARKAPEWLRAEVRTQAISIGEWW